MQGDEKAGRVPAEDRLKLLLNSAQRINDNSSYVMAMERLVTHYPKKEYWAICWVVCSASPTSATGSRSTSTA